MSWRGAGARYDNDRAAGIVDRAGQRVPRGDGRYTDETAGAAEDLVARFFGARSPRETRSPDGGWDLILPNGLKVDVKWTPRENGRLQLDVRSKSHADVYILVTGEIEDLLMAGWCWDYELKQAANIWTPPGVGRTPCWAVPQSRLHEISELKLASR